MSGARMHCTPATAAALIELGWARAPHSTSDVTMFVHDDNEAIEFWEDGTVNVFEFSGQNHWQPIQINSETWRAAWRVILPEVMG